jgi:hypothetical protein
MAGQGLTAEQIAAAAGQQGAANQQQATPAQNQQQQQQAPPAQNQQQQAPGNQFILNQEQFDQRYGEKLTALERELGLEPGAFKDPASLKARLGQKKPPAQAQPGEKLTGNELRLAKMEVLMEFDIPSKRIPLILENFNISGSTREEVRARVQSLIDTKLLPMEAPAANPGNNQQQPNQPPNAAQGAGNLGVPGAPPAAKIWKESEIRELRLSGGLTEAILADIKKAAAEGRVQ